MVATKGKVGSVLVKKEQGAHQEEYENTKYNTSHLITNLSIAVQ